MSLRKAFVFILFLVATVPSAAQSKPAWDEHGPLGVSKDGHRLVHRDGTPFLWLGDTAWGLVQQLTREDIDLYLDDRKRLGFNVVQTVAYWYPHGGGMPMGPHNAADVYGFRPFEGGDDAPDVRRPLVVSSGSATAPNDYWDHLDYAIAAARRRGMYLAVLPCWARAYVTAQMNGSRALFDEASARAYGEFLGRRYRDEPHVLWVLGGDAKAQFKGLDRGRTELEWDKRAVFRAMAEGLLAGATGVKALWNEPSDAWKRIFITYHPDGDPTVNSSTWFHNDPWLTANGVEVWKETSQVYPVMFSEYRLASPVKPSLFLEGSYEYGSYRHECGWVTPARARRQAYHTFFAGGAGHTYGAGPIWAMRGTGGDYNCGYTWKQALAFPGAANFGGVVRRFLESHDWQRWIPEPNTIDRGEGEGEESKVGIVTAERDLEIIYFPVNSFARIRNKLGAEAAAEWFDPRSGATEKARGFAADESSDLVPPTGWEDAILILRPKK